MTHSILVVDDDPHIREMVRFALGKAGMAARAAERVPDAVLPEMAPAPASAHPRTAEGGCGPIGRAWPETASLP